MNEHRRTGQSRQPSSSSVPIVWILADVHVQTATLRIFLSLSLLYIVPVQILLSRWWKKIPGFRVGCDLQRWTFPLSESLARCHDATLRISVRVNRPVNLNRRLEVRQEFHSHVLFAWTNPNETLWIHDQAEEALAAKRPSDIEGRCDHILRHSRNGLC